MKHYRLFVLSAICTALSAESNQKIRVTIGEPNAWSVEQAHYLLEQRAARNQGLRPKEPGPEDLDPNAITGNRFQALRQTFAAGVSLDQATGVQNVAAQKRLQLDLASFEANRAALANSLITQKGLSDKIAGLGKAKRAAAEAGASDSVLKAYDSEIAGQQTLLETEKRDADRINALMANVPSTLKSVEGGKTDFSQFPAPALAALLGDKSAFSGDPKTQASAALDNYVNFQMELLMKQITLLRDATPPSRRIVFIELPQSFQIAGDSFWSRVRDRVVKVQWQIVGYTRPLPRSDYGPEGAEKVLDKPYLRRDLVLCMERLRNGAGQCELPLGTTGTSDEPNSYSYQATTAFGRSNVYLQQVLEPRSPVARKASSPGDREKLLNIFSQNAVPLTASVSAGGTSRVIDLAPRIGSLNVNDKNYVSNGLALFGAFRWLTGWGASASYQRQKENYEQFIHQEIFAAAYGKGDPNFGWTFGPNPGTRVLAPGIRTTYATLEVPSSALGLTLEARACTYERDEVQPAPWDEKDKSCDSTQTFYVVLPTRAQSDFWVEDVQFKTAAPGARQVVRLRGGYFSNLTGVTVDGIAMRRAVAIANPEMTPPPRPDSGRGPDSVLSGEFEIINGREMLIAFRGAPDYIGTPQIQITSPVRSFVLNGTRFHGRSLDERTAHGDVMFAPASKVTDYSISNRAGGGFTLHLTGEGLREDTVVEVGGARLTGARQHFKTERMDIGLASLAGFENDSVRFIVYNEGDGAGSKAVATELPGWDRPSVAKVEAISRQCAVKDCSLAAGAHNYWMYRFTGKNLGGLTIVWVHAANGASMGHAWEPVSSTEALLNIDQVAEGAYAIVRLQRPASTGTSAVAFSQFVTFKMPSPEQDDKFRDKELIIKRVPKESAGSK